MKLSWINCIMLLFVVLIGCRPLEPQAPVQSAQEIPPEQPIVQNTPPAIQQTTAQDLPLAQQVQEAQAEQPVSQQSANNSSDTCDANLWQHVYNPERLQIINNCTTVTGTIKLLRKEKDGDYHIQLALDPQYQDLINENNNQDQNGNLVIEPVCAHSVTQEDAIDACAGFSSNVNIPQVGEHVKVVGSYVLDTNHGWMEIHPITSIEVIN